MTTNSFRVAFRKYRRYQIHQESSHRQPALNCTSEKNVQLQEQVDDAVDGEGYVSITYDGTPRGYQELEL